MTGRDALRARGWSVTAGRDYVHAVRRTGVGLGPDPAVSVGHPDPEVAGRAVDAACLVIDGHDLIGLLRDAPTHAVGYLPPQVRDWFDRMAAAVAAVDGAT